MKKKWCLLFIFPLAALILELLPYGAVLRFARPDGAEPFRQTFSYFNLTPFGYANFGPFLTAVLTVGLLFAAFLTVLSGSRRGLTAIAVLSACALLTSIMPLFFGFVYYPITAALISVCFLAQEALVWLLLKNN